MSREKVTAYFNTFKAAQDTMDDLKNAGFSGAYLDLNDQITDMDTQINQPGTASSNNSLASLVLKSGSPAVSFNRAPLMAANPMVSGMGDFEEIFSVRCRLIVETDRENTAQVKEIIKNREGSFEDPHVGLPKGLENVGLEEVILSNIEQI
ncbi:hypothetical protein [Candidatus Formimonas warabiya]|uniref:Uncharacterized protein n=1 Tax=Formimonas warabiya TaxID=1761012 RepID=A0A3G1KPE2_FORW1|nr:hypothetical protein [Candidatus Formimonas warabiya]ATW24317.1 hypothetical protein DCMF_05505 [Candidatus Formimonas warabiya]